MICVESLQAFDILENVISTEIGRAVCFKLKGFALDIDVQTFGQILQLNSDRHSVEPRHDISCAAEARSVRHLKPNLHLRKLLTQQQCKFMLKVCLGMEERAPLGEL